MITLGVLGPLQARDERGPIVLPGPRHRAVLARLLVARGAVVPVSRLVDDLWPQPTPGAVGAVQTFVGALRRALEPERPPRTPARLLVTLPPGYALQLPADAVDAWRLEADLALAGEHLAGGRAADARTLLDRALASWRGPAYAEFRAEHWALPEVARLDELRLLALVRRADAMLALGLAAEAVPELEAHVTSHPLHEDGWRLLALALYRTGRQGDALATVRRARQVLREELGVDPGPDLRQLEGDLFAQAPRLADIDGAVAALGPTPGAPRLEALMAIVRALAVTGDLEGARRHRGEAIEAAEQLGEPILAARVIGAFDVPALWTANDDPALADRVVAAAERAVSALGAGHRAERARLLSTIALERRADPSGRGADAARRAEALARQLGDPQLLVFALNARFLQSFHRAGLAPERAAIGEELVAIAAAHGLVTFEVLGHLVLVQAQAALADLTAADEHVAAAGRLAERHELPLVGVFTAWYRALRLAVTGPVHAAADAYRAAAAQLEGTGMPGVEAGILPLALHCLGATDHDADPGPYAPWIAAGSRPPDSPRDVLFELRTCLQVDRAMEAGDLPLMQRLYEELIPAAGELAGAGSGLVTLGPVAQRLGRLALELGRDEVATGHLRAALKLAERAGSPHWTAAALAALPS